MMSQDSSTTIASSIESEVGVDSFPMPSRQSLAPEQGSLSPVVESPGRSPVSYPKIPRLHKVPAITNNTTSPIITNYSSNDKSISGSQETRPLQHPRLRVVNASEPRDSPTLGVVDSQKPVQMGTVRAAAAVAPAQAHLSYYDPLKRQSVNPNPNRNPGQVRSGSPDGAGGMSPSSSRTPQLQQPPYGPRSRPALQSFQHRIDNDRGRLPSQSHYGPMSIYDAYARPESNYTQGPALTSQQHQQRQHQYQRQQQQHQYQQRQQHQQQQQQQQQYKPYRQHMQQYPNTASPSPLSATHSPSASTSSSTSLLAKRLGPEKAAAFQVTAPVENTYNSSQARWKRRSSSPGRDAGPDPDVDGGPRGGPVTPTPRALVVRKKAGAGGREDEDGAGGRDVPPLPATPGWKPQLTPQRRGRDLYLSVQ